MNYLSPFSFSSHVCADSADIFPRRVAQNKPPSLPPSSSSSSKPPPPNPLFGSHTYPLARKAYGRARGIGPERSQHTEVTRPFSSLLAPCAQHKAKLINFLQGKQPYPGAFQIRVHACTQDARSQAHAGAGSDRAILSSRIGFATRATLRVFVSPADSELHSCEKARRVRGKGGNKKAAQRRAGK